MDAAHRGQRGQERAARPGATPPSRSTASILTALGLADWIARYKGEANVRQALLLGGGVNTPAGDFDSSMQMMETGLFDGFKRLHVAGHPEGTVEEGRRSRHQPTSSRFTSS